MEYSSVGRALQVYILAPISFIDSKILSIRGLQPMYICVCGKQFNTANQLNGHKSSCKQYLGEERYFKLKYLRRQAGIKGSDICSQKRKRQRAQKLQDWVDEKHKCETCGKIMTQFYGTGRFCNRQCSNKYPRNHNKKSKAYKNDLKIPCPYCGKTFPNRGGLTNHIIYKHLGVENKGKRLYHYTTTHSRTGEHRVDFPNITVEEMKQYKQIHTKCEICGKTIEEIKKENNQFKGLCIDHNHINNKFRGLLCVTCNRNLGWFEHNKDNVLNYLNKQM